MWLRKLSIEPQRSSSPLSSPLSFSGELSLPPDGPLAPAPPTAGRRNSDHRLLPTSSCPMTPLPRASSPICVGGVSPNLTPEKVRRNSTIHHNVRVTFSRALLANEKLSNVTVFL